MSMDSLPSRLTSLLSDYYRDEPVCVSYYNDPVCGRVGIADGALEVLSESQKWKVAKVLAQRNLRTPSHQSKPPVLVAEAPSADSDFRLVSMSELLALYPSSVASIFDEALINLSMLVDFPSDKIEIDEANRWFIYGHDHDSENYILTQLINLGYVTAAGARSGGLYMIQSIIIAAPGWSRLNELLANRPMTDQVFVAMWFHADMHEIYQDGIRVAIEGLGLRSVRIDAHEHNNKICDEIISEIKRSRFLVADFSGQRGGVYYEAGFAHGLGIPVVWTVREEDLPNVHFDTRQYNHIVYTTPSELAEKLTNRIQATIL